MQPSERVGEVGLADEAHVVLAAAAAEAERVGEGEAGERGGVVVDGFRGVEALEVDIERGAVVEAQDAVALAAGDEHGIADAAPAVLDADPERRVGADRDADDGVVEHLGAVELVGGGHREVVPGAAADERDDAAGDVVGAADDLLLVAGEAVGEDEQGLVGAWLESFEAARDLGAGLAQAGGDVARQRGLDREALAAECHHDDAVVGGAARADLAGGGAADERRVLRVDPGQQCL